MLRERGRQLYVGLMASDVLIALAMFAALLLTPRMQRPGVNTDLGLATLIGLAAIVALGWPLILSRAGAYHSQRRESLSAVTTRLFGANGIGALLLSTLAFALDAPVAPSFPLLLATCIFALQVALRIPVLWALHAARRSGRNFRNVLIIGAGPRAIAAEQTIELHPEWGLRIVGFIDERDSAPSDYRPLAPADRIHKFIELPLLLRNELIDEVLVACPLSLLESLAPAVRECALVGVPVTLLTDLFGEELPPPRVGLFDSRRTITFAPVHHNEVELGLKRGIDIVGATIGLVVAAPLMALAALAVRLGSRGPAFFVQRRCGLYGRPFKMYKLRTMVADAEGQKASLMHLNEMDGPVFKIKDDPRVTAVGRWLRKFSIDEMPQFWNVLNGDMSLVGPRPPTPDEVALYEGAERRRLSMRPGLTCSWQANGRNQVGFSDWMKLDLQYIDDWNLSADFRILLKTLPQIMLGRGAS